MTDPFDADRLDAWLEGIPFPSTSLNGQSDTQSDLVGTAQRFHAGIGAAERGLPVPARAIWEDVMQRTADLTISPPVIAATNGNGGPRRPGASHRPTAEPPHGRGYWFATGSLIVIAVLAIIAVAYLANRPSNGDDGAPGILGSAVTPEQFATPGANTLQSSTAEIEAWLAAAANYTCPPATPTTSLTPSSEPWPTDLVLEPDSYLPFAAPSATDLESLNDTLLGIQANCGSRFPVSPDFAWIPGPPLAVPTNDQITAAKEISAGLPNQDPASYFMVVPSDEIAAHQGESIALPSDVVQLADGRLGVPSRFVWSSEEDLQAGGRDAMAKWTGDDVYAVTVFSTFERSGETWLIDEMFVGCVGECDRYWAMLTDEAFIASFGEATPAEPEPDDRWLGPIDNSVCAPPSVGISSSDWITDQVPDVSAYLPFGPAEQVQQEAIAETALLIASGCVDSTMLTDDVAWSFGTVGTRPSSEQVVASQEISAALPDQDPANYFIMYESDDPDYRGRTVVLPDDVVMLADGRLGVPSRLVFTDLGDATWARSQMGNGTFTITSFSAYERSGDRWLLDEMVTICVGECDQVWESIANGTNLEGTPDSLTDDPASYNAITAEDCPAVPAGFAAPPAVTPIDPGGDPYATVFVPGVKVLTDVTNSVREWRGCQVAGDEAGQVALQTANFTDNGGTTQDPRFPELTDPLDRQITATNFQENRQHLTDSMLDGDWHDFNVTVDSLADDETYLTPLGNRAMVLADARIAVPLMTIWPSSAEYFEANKPYWFVPIDVLIWSDEANRWLVDESFLLCAGDCDQFLRELDTTEGVRVATETPSAGTTQTPESQRIVTSPEATTVDPGFIIPPPDSTYTDDGFKHPQGTPGVESTSVIVLPPVGGTPEVSDGSPAASPVDGLSPDEQYTPLRAEECAVTGLSMDEVSTVIRDPGEEPDRSYVPVGPADAAVAEAAIAADRAWQSCLAYGSIGQRTVLQTPWLTANGPATDPNGLPSDDVESIVVERQPLSDAMLSDDPFDYLMSSGQTQEEMVANLTAPSVTMPASRGSFELEDGRIAVPQVTVLAEDAYQFSADWSPDYPYFIVPMHIMAQDPATGDWLVDEVTWLCGGDCEQLIVNVRAYEAAMRKQSGQESATPEATPAAGS